MSTARDASARGDLPPAFKMLTRVARIFEQLNNPWDVLRTMTPSEYTQFRDERGASLRVQSHQYRLIEFIFGNRNRAMMKVHHTARNCITCLVKSWKHALSVTLCWFSWRSTWG